MQDVLQWLAGLPPVLTYTIIGLGAAIENIIPPIPADTFVLLGAFLAESGRASTTTVFLVTWTCNVISAAAVYVAARKYGRGFFATRIGHALVQPGQMKQIGTFYERYGVPAIFMSRFLPAFRALVPVFAGVTHVSPLKVFPPLAIASAVWYGALVYLGALAGRNWEAIMAFFGRASTVLLVIASVLLAAVGLWWWRSRDRGGD